PRMAASNMLRLVPVFALAIVLSWAARASAASLDNWNHCRNRSFDHPKAIRACDQIIDASDISPIDKASALIARGFHKNIMGEHEKAIEDATAAIAINPNRALAYENRSAAEFDLSRYDAALSDGEIAIRLSPDGARGYINRGKAFLGKGE